MPSALKSATARANGAKSKGPKSAATREKSSLNATRHGFTAHNTVLLQCEDPDLFQKIRIECLATYKPATPEEEVLVDEMIVTRWRIQRLWTIETALFDREVIRRQPEMEEGTQPNPAANLAAAFSGLADESRSLALLSAMNPPPSHVRAYLSHAPPVTAGTAADGPARTPTSGAPAGSAGWNQAGGPNPKPVASAINAQRKCETNPTAIPRRPEQDRKDSLFGHENGDVG